MVFKKKESIWCWERNMWRGEVLEKVEHRGRHGISQTHHVLFQNSQTIKIRACEGSSEKNVVVDRRGNERMVMGHEFVQNTPYVCMKFSNNNSKNLR